MTQNIDKINHIKHVLQAEGQRFGENGEVEYLAGQVEAHREGLKNELGYKVSWNDAVFSWYENIYTPIRNTINAWWVKKSFPQSSDAKLIADITDHWNGLSASHPQLAGEIAAAHYIRRNRMSFKRRIATLFGGSSPKKDNSPNRKKAA